VALEELDGALVPFGGFPRFERSEISTPPRFRIALSRVETIFAR
jgi:hypothetical protein